MNLTEYLKDHLPFPREIHLESSSKCNANCIICPRQGMERYQGDMGRDIFLKAVEGCVGRAMDYIHFHLNGEPLMMDINELCFRINHSKLLNPNIDHAMFTNASLLTKDKADKILQSRLDIIVFSVDGGNKKDYEYARPGLIWENVVDNIRYFVKQRNAIKSKMKTQSGIVPTIYNKSSMDDYYKIFKGIGIDDVGGSGVINIGGYIDSDNMMIKETQYMKGDINAPCTRLFLDLSIMADGQAAICTQDTRGDHVVGNLKTQSIKEIWQGDYLNYIRMKFIEGKKCDIKHCAKCDYMRSNPVPEWWGDKEFKIKYLQAKKDGYGK